ncbi:MAG: FAD-dependent oxidoreductase, partial [Betaproteobacteria bacterium]|nr:FAD-dependent oxidoreductase [Betaproteobacteria bacterium]
MPHDDHGFTTHARGEVVSGRGDLAFVPKNQPGAAEDALHLQLEDHGIGVHRAMHTVRLHQHCELFVAGHHQPSIRQNTVMAKFATLVVGGGIGGLSLARELSIRGLPVTVLEKAPQLNPVGAGIIMNPNAMRVLERNGLADALRPNAWPYLMRETCDRRGTLLATRDYRPLYESGKLSRGALVHRAHLLEALFNGVPKGGVHFGVTLKSIDLRADGVRVDTERHGAFEAQILVGADGIHSAVRRHAFGDIAPLYMGYRSHRMVVDNVAGTRNFTEFLGHGQRIGLVPISEKRLYVWTTFNSPRDRPPVLDSVGRFRELFAQFTDERVRRALSQVRSPDEIISTEIEELRLAQWV